MSTERHPGTNVLDRLTAHYDRRARVCPACGYEDESGHWRAQSDGHSVEYRHTCPSCGAVDRRALELD